jgi:hypothetical protein
MTMNEKIIAMVRRSPGIKTGQVADQLDISFEEAQTALAKLVNDGLIKGALVVLSGGGKVMSYELTDKGTKLIPPQPFAKPPVAPKPAIPDLPQPTSKIQRAILHIEKNGPTASAALRSVMDLASDANVASYLAPAVKNGRLHLDDGLWKLGAATPKALETVEVVGNVILATRDATRVPAEVKTAVTKAAAPPVIELKPPAPETKPMQSDTAPGTPAIFRCARWTDGTLELQVSGRTVLELDADEQALLRTVLA